MVPSVEQVAALWLLQMVGLGSVSAARLVASYAPEELLRVGEQSSVALWQEIFGKVPKTAPERERLAEQLQGWRRSGLTIVTPWELVYPRRLALLDDRPLLLFMEGDISLLDRFAIAIVGSRNPTSYGRRMARKLAGELANAGVVVVSGHALGIDQEAHLGAVEAGGATIAFLGGTQAGVRRQNPVLYQKLIDKGLAVSEYPPGTPVQSWMFPARNRLIAAHGHGTVIVEAEIKSGTMITARLSAEMGRDLFAVPGQADNPYAEGPLALLRDGAGVAVCAQDILGAYLELTPPRISVPPRVELPEPLQPTHRWLTEHQEATPDEVAEGLHLPLPDILIQLTQLELLGAVTQTASNRYRPLTAA